MSGVATVLRDLHHAVTELAEQYRRVSERQISDPGTRYPCRTLADQCDTHADWLRVLADRGGAAPGEPRHHDTLLTAAADLVRRGRSQRVGRRPVAGRTLLEDLNGLYVMAADVHLRWLLLAQAARVVRDEDLLAAASAAGRQAHTQVVWLRTRLMETVPQTLTTGTDH